VAVNVQTGDRPLPPRNSTILGFDPGRDKCGVAIRQADGTLAFHQVITATQTLSTLKTLCQQWQVDLVVIGNQTTSKQWYAQLRETLPGAIAITPIDERYTTLQARDRYWQMYPPKGLGQLIPQSLRKIPRPIDDIVAILLIERHLAEVSSSL